MCIRDSDAVGHLAGKAHLMGDHQHGDAGVGQLFHQLKHFADHLGVEGAGRPVSYTHLDVYKRQTKDSITYFEEIENSLLTKKII